MADKGDRSRLIAAAGAHYLSHRLLALADWLTGRGVTHVAMEATGVYGKPVWHVLDEAFEQVLALAPPGNGARGPRRRSTGS